MLLNRFQLRANQEDSLHKKGLKNPLPVPLPEHRMQLSLRTETKVLDYTVWKMGQISYIAFLYEKCVHPNNKEHILKSD